MGHIELKKLFEGLQTQMTTKLDTNRTFISHPGSKGDATENVWIEYLKTYLPNRYSVEKAIVIDSEGNTSDQIDIVIYDNLFTPFIFSQNDFKYIPAESVYAVFEVKQDLSNKHVNYASEKVASVRRLKRTTTDMISCGKKQNARPLTEIIGGILCSTTTLSQNTIKKNLKSKKGMYSLDIGCVTDFGSFYLDYDSISMVQEGEDFLNHINQYYEGRIAKDVHFSQKENSLVTFFIQLSQYLQQSIGTVAAIDFQAYLNNIGEKIDKDL